MKFLKDLLELNLIEKPVMPNFGQLDEYEGEILWAELEEDEKKWRESRNAKSA